MLDNLRDSSCTKNANRYKMVANRAGRPWALSTNKKLPLLASLFIPPTLFYQMEAIGGGVNTCNFLSVKIIIKFHRLCFSIIINYWLE